MGLNKERLIPGYITVELRLKCLVIRFWTALDVVK